MELELTEFTPVLIYFAAVLGFAVVTILAPHIVAAHKRTAVKDMPYESGMDPQGSTRNPLSIKFYLIAILFLVFDVELLYIYPWAVALDSQSGADGRIAQLLVMLSLIGSVVLAYAYAWRKGVFQWRNN